MMKYIYNIGERQLEDTTIPVGTQLNLFKEQPQAKIKKEKIGYVKTLPKEKPTYPFDTPQGIDHVTKTLKEDYGNNLNSKDQTDLNILNKEMKLGVLKDEIGGLKKFDHHDKSTYPSDPEVSRRLKNISDLEKSLGYESPELNVSYKKDQRSPNQKKAASWEATKKTVQQLRNLKSHHQGNSEQLNRPENKKFDMWNDGIKTDKPPQNLSEVRRIINEEYKRNGTQFLTPDEHKFIDKEEEPKTSSVVRDDGLSQLESSFAQLEPNETVEQFIARREREYKANEKQHEFNRAVKSGVGTLFKINKGKI